MRCILSCLFLASFWLGLTLSIAWGQVPAEKLEHRSNLGMKFVSVPGTAALLAVHETRVADWQAFLSATGYDWTYKPHFEQGPDHPVVGITLADARAFCSWLTEQDRAAGTINTAQSYRLPTRTEWDAAVGLKRTRKPDLTVEEKVDDERTFPWGMAWPPPAKTANLAEGEIPGYSDGFPFTAPVGQFTPSAEGLYDLTGNVWEWCWDPEVRAEQVGVLRGGSWAYFRQECLRSSYLYLVPVDMRMPTIGFRCVFEDRQRTAIMLAAAEKIKTEIRTQRREEIIGGAVNKEELAAMKEKLTAAPALAGLTDASTPLVPAKPGQPHTNSLGMEFVPLPDSNLLFGVTEVRVQDFETWLKDAGRSWENKPPFLLSTEHPAVSVTWEEATAFCAWLTEKERKEQLISANASYRLPADLEWSQAAGLTNETGADPAARAEAVTLHYPWSAEGVFPPPIASTNLDSLSIDGYRDSHSYTAPVMSEDANALGIRGLGGNASEWCLDIWPGAPDERLVRGGSWLSRDKDQLRTGSRQHLASTSSNTGVGFRAVLEMPAP
ncbi:SUMF1/EgtB/PvdO family nonheme iron enzyme [Prosthecobacter sp. SYSU 5D2]